MKWKDSLVLLIPCLALYLILALYALQFRFFAMDEYTYMLTAREFLRGNYFNSPDAERFPLFPFLLSTAYQVFGESEVVAKGLSAAFGLLTVITVFFLAKKVSGDDRTAFASTLITACSPFLVFFSARALTESLFTFLLTAFGLLMLKSVEDDKHLVTLAATSALLFLTRYFGLYAVPVAVIYYYLKKGFPKPKWLLLSALSFLLVLSPWLYYSQLLTGNPVGLLSSFFQGQVQTNDAGMSLPDKIPSYTIALPLLLGPAIILLPLIFFKKARQGVWKKGFPIILLVAIPIALLEIYGFLHPRLLRYEAVFAPFLAIIAAVALSESRELFKKTPFAQALLLTGIVVASIFSSVFAENYFSTYQKHVSYRQVGVFMKENCAGGGVYSNLRVLSQYYTDAKPVEAENASKAECVAKSDYEYEFNLRESDLKEKELVFETKGTRVWK
jgi:4-amino-4-deoxy-L-arabinose transferase-like glycosyltransferase